MPGQELKGVAFNPHEPAQHKLRSSSDPAWAEGCACHGTPGIFQRDPRYKHGGFWRCRVAWNAKERKRYHDMDPVAYARRHLLNRRWKAVQRMTARVRNREGS